MNKFLFLLSIISIVFSCSPVEKRNKEVIVKEFRLYLDNNDLDNIYKNYKENIYIPVKIVHNGDTVKAKMRLRGDTSRGYDKKSMKIVFKKGEVLNGEKRKINLNSEWTDVTYIRQYVSSELMNLAGINTYKSNYVAVYVNDSFFGLFLQVENVDKQFLIDRDLDPKANLYKATHDGACLSMFEYENPQIKWEKKTNKQDTSFADLQKLILNVNNINNADFKPFLQKTFEYNKLIKLIALNMLIKNGSTYYHNYYLYHDINGNGKWQIMPWDMDKTLNYYNWGPYDFQRTSSNWESDNPLIEKMLINDEVFTDIKNEVENLSKNIFNKDVIFGIIAEAEKSLEKYVALDTKDKIESVEKWKTNLNNEKDYVLKRKDELTKQLETYPRGFCLKNTNIFPIGAKATFEWYPARSPIGKNIKYTLKYGPDFLLEDTNTTRIIKDIDATSITIDERLYEGKYYWRVYATDGSVTIEGFNSKSLFYIVKPLKIPNSVKGIIKLTDIKTPYLLNNNLTIKTNESLIIQKGVKLFISENVHLNITGKLIVGEEKEEKAKIYSMGQINKLNFLNSAEKSKITNANFYNIGLNIKKSLVEINKLTALITEKKNNIKNLFNITESDINLTNIVAVNNHKNTSIFNIFYFNKSKINIEHSYFKGFDNCINMFECYDSKITNNRFVVFKNNGINVETSKNIEITNNSFQYLKAAVQINKSDIKSEDITILANKFEKIDTGILVKAKVENFNYLGNTLTKKETKEIIFDLAKNIKPSTNYRKITKIDTELVLNKTDKPYFIADTVVVVKTGRLIIEKGVSIMFSKEAVLFVQGELIINGSEKENVNIFPQDKYSNKILIESAKESNINFANIKDLQVIVSCPIFNLTNSIISIYERPSSREKNDFVVFNGFKGEYNILNNYFINHSKYVYENMNIFNSKVDVSNNTIFGFEDSIEPINCSGKVKYNTVLYAPNDAVDVNGCKDIDIENNIFYKITDKGVSVGAEQFGKSEGIRIKNNMFYACDYGVEVKNNSTAYIENNTFIKNKTAIKLDLKKTGHENDMGGTAYIQNCVFYNSIDTDFNVDKVSKISVVNSISDNDNTIKGITKHDIDFENPNFFDYSLSEKFVKSTLNTIIGYEK